MISTVAKIKRSTRVQRRAFDFYETPKWQTAALRGRLKISGTVFEPCVGDSSIADEFRDCCVATNDINSERTADWHLDAARPDAWKSFHACDWVVTNPPFNRAFEILTLAHKHARKGVVMLLRLSFLEPTQARSYWLSQTPPQAQFILPRCSYTEDGKTDSVTTAWFVWAKGVRPQIQIIPREEIR